MGEWVGAPVGMITTRTANMHICTHARTHSCITTPTATHTRADCDSKRLRGYRAQGPVRPAMAPQLFPRVPRCVKVYSKCKSEHQSAVRKPIPPSLKNRPLRSAPVSTKFDPPEDACPQVRLWTKDPKRTANRTSRCRNKRERETCREQTAENSQQQLKVWLTAVAAGTGTLATPRLSTRSRSQ